MSFLSIFSLSSYHGFYWEDYTYIFSTSILEEISNQGNLPWICAEICNSSGNISNLYGKECIAEELISHPDGGAMLVSAPSSVAYKNFAGPAPGGVVSILFADLLFSDNVVTAGVTHALAKDIFWASWNTSYPSAIPEWTMQSVNLYGDPCTVFVGAPEGVESGSPQRLNVQVTPNPVSLTMSIIVTLAEPTPVKVIVYDMLGRIALSRGEEIRCAGEQSFSMDASSLAAGIYMVNVVAGDQPNTAKCVVLH